MRGLIAPAIAAVLTAGCAASGADRPFIPGGGEGGPAAGASATTAGAAPRTETLAVDSGLKVIVEWPGGITAEHTEMLETFRDAYVGMFKGVVTRGRDEHYMTLMELEAGKTSFEWVKKYVDKKRSVRGTARLFGLKVSSVQDRAAQVDVCVDETQVRYVDARTGQDLPAEPGSDDESVYLQSAGVHQGDDGNWRIKLFRYAELTNERAKGCRR
ncbi:hypothetical protein C1I98_21030 [Spongiactinospora gelatinilytica]|uniref:Lipoprotein n=1 Tax=Spongiactinospora gelatinilytica TaxID=2666298 RepID=A0A2W2GNI7_9ACTN|nr:hypothetical protein [Spongiactinospora gelatinilytica]PZG41615.1 hypothetical protein C1I98_21030 [Spongiactinospora gelatinilytica]